MCAPPLLHKYKFLKYPAVKLYLISVLLLAIVAQQQCNSKILAANCYKGRLEVKGICANYTIKLLSGKMDPSKLEASWTDEHTKKTYTNVFALASPCSFPSNLKEGDEFYFTLAAPEQNCAVCQAYYPKPSKALAITVLDKPCP